MLDVHAPEHSIGGARDFFLHLFTITCGLLIALALENAAEALHHRSERREAEAIIRQELRENQQMIGTGAPILAGEIKALEGLLVYVEARSEGKNDVVPSHDPVNFNDAEIQDAAWRTASSTGVLAYMDYAEVEKYSTAYKEQDLLQKQAEQTISDYLQMLSILGGTRGGSGGGAGGVAGGQATDASALTPERAILALPYVRRSLADLFGVMAYGKGTAGAYEDALK